MAMIIMIISALMIGFGVGLGVGMWYIADAYADH